MSDLNVTTIQNNNIAKTDKLLVFNNNDSKAAEIQDVVQLVPGVMGVATCNTAGNVATKAVTCDNWNNQPGQSILVEFANGNSANNISLSINGGAAIPVYYMNTATEQVSGAAIPAGAVVFTLNAAGNKFYAHVTKTLATVDTTSKLPVNSLGISNFVNKNRVINVDLQNGKTLHIQSPNPYCGYIGIIQVKGSGAKFFQVRNTADNGKAFYLMENVTIDNKTFFAFVQKIIPYNFTGNDNYSLTISITNYNVYIENKTNETESISVQCNYNFWEIVNNS